MTIAFCGGGTMGPVTPLIAVLRQMKKMNGDLKFIWIGTPGGPERQAVEAEGVNFFSIPVVKFPRYLSASWLSWPYKYLKAKAAAKKIIKDKRPDLIVSAGGFTGVPIMKVANSLGIPCVIHQLDAEPGLSNKSVTRLCASITTSYRYEKPPFPGIKSECVPTPNRFTDREVPLRMQAVDFFGLDESRPIIFVVGGGTGAAVLNEAVWSVMGELLKRTQIIHMTGKGKDKKIKKPGYYCREFFNEKELLNAYAAADLVVSRAGIGGISDLAALSRPAIFVPIPDSHQEKNLEKLSVEKVDQRKDFAKNLTKKIFELLSEDAYRQDCGKRLHEDFPTDNGSMLAKRWLGLISSL
ncbi:MAG: glycosyltransferase [Patescibacteria group bacterium]